MAISILMVSVHSWQVEKQQSFSIILFLLLKQKRLGRIKGGVRRINNKKRKKLTCHGCGLEGINAYGLLRLSKNLCADLGWTWDIPLKLDKNAESEGGDEERKRARSG
jgi:hypothetical protein